MISGGGLMRIYLFGKKSLLAIASLLHAATAVIDILAVDYLGKIIDSATAGSIQLMFRNMIYAGAATMLSLVIFIFSIQLHLKYVSDGVLVTKHEILKSILHRPLISFRSKNDAYYMNLLNSDVNILRDDRLFQAPYLLYSAILVLGAAYFLLRSNVWLFAATLVRALLPLLTTNLFTKGAQKRKRALSDENERYTNALKEAIEGYETIRMGSDLEAFCSVFDGYSRRQQQAYSKSRIFNAISYNAMRMIGTFLLMGCVGLGGYLIIQGQVTAGQLLSAIFLMNFVSDGINNFIEGLVSVRSARPIAEKLETEVNTRDSKHDGGKISGEATIEFENITFAFEDRTLYRNFSCTFRKGGCYAIIGESGCGKSTLTKLLLKYYDNYKGSIRIFGRDIRTIPEQDLYEIVGLVNQTPFMFNAPMYENIVLYGSEPEKESESYHKLLQDLNLTALAERVGNTPLGDFGDNISGGERQRISIARAMRRHPQILIFDEPTTGLDPENRSMINEFIFSHSDITRVVVSHDWSKEYLERFDGVIRVG